MLCMWSISSGEQTPGQSTRVSCVLAQLVSEHFPEFRMLFLVWMQSIDDLVCLSINFSFNGIWLSRLNVILPLNFSIYSANSLKSTVRLFRSRSQKNFLTFNSFSFPFSYFECFFTSSVNSIDWWSMKDGPCDTCWTFKLDPEAMK